MQAPPRADGTKIPFRGKMLYGVHLCSLLNIRDKCNLSTPINKGCFFQCCHADRTGLMMVARSGLQSIKYGEEELTKWSRGCKIFTPLSVFRLGQSVSGRVVRSPRLRHRNELIVKAWEKTVQGLGIGEKNDYLL